MRRPDTPAPGVRTGKRAPGVSSLYEMIEFAGFPGSAQRYIRRSLDVGLKRGDPIERWARGAAEAAAINEQIQAYRTLDRVRRSVPDDTGLAAAEALMAPLIRIVAFDLGNGRLNGFASCRFLYERLVGAAVRPWLPAAFSAAAALPHLHPERRRMLLQSMPEDVAAAPGWSMCEPLFFPAWVDEIDPGLAS